MPSECNTKCSQQRKNANQMNCKCAERKNLGRWFFVVLLHRPSNALNCEVSWLKLAAKETIEEKESAEKRTRTHNLKFRKRRRTKWLLLHFYCCRCHCCRVDDGGKEEEKSRRVLHHCSAGRQSTLGICATNPIPFVLRARPHRLSVPASCARLACWHFFPLSPFLASFLQWRASCSFCINNYLTNN